MKIWVWVLLVVYVALPFHALAGDAGDAAAYERYTRALAIKTKRYQTLADETPEAFVTQTADVYDHSTEGGEIRKVTVDNGYLGYVLSLYGEMGRVYYCYDLYEDFLSVVEVRTEYIAPIYEDDWEELPPETTHYLQDGRDWYRLDHEQKLAHPIEIPMNLYALDELEEMLAEALP